MRARSLRNLIPWVVLLAVCLTATESYAQSTAAPIRPSNQNPGRFQLVPENQGTMFLVDTATGRVWRYTLVTPPESDVKAYVDAAIAIQEASNGRTFPETERKALFEKLAKERRDELQALNNPCKGLVTCFVEVRSCAAHAKRQVVIRDRRREMRLSWLSGSCRLVDVATPWSGCTMAGTNTVVDTAISHQGTSELAPVDHPGCFRFPSAHWLCDRYLR